MLVQNYVSEGKKDEVKTKDGKVKSKKTKDGFGVMQPKDQGTPHLKITDKLTKTK